MGVSLEELETAVVEAVPETVAICRTIAAALTYLADALEAHSAPKPLPEAETSASPTEPVAPSGSEAVTEASAVTSVETAVPILGG